MDLTAEMLESFTAVHGYQGKELAETRKSIELATLMQRETEEEKKRAQRHFHDMKKTVEESRRHLREASRDDSCASLLGCIILLCPQ